MSRHLHDPRITGQVVLNGEKLTATAEQLNTAAAGGNSGSSVKAETITTTDQTLILSANYTIVVIWDGVASLTLDSSALADGDIVDVRYPNNAFDLEYTNANGDEEHDDSRTTSFNMRFIYNGTGFFPYEMGSALT